MVRFVIVLKPDRGRWKYVHRRVTYDRDTGELLSDESVEGLTNAQLFRKLDQLRRLRVEFYFSDVHASRNASLRVLRQHRRYLEHRRDCIRASLR